MHEDISVNYNTYMYLIEGLERLLKENIKVYCIGGVNLIYVQNL